MKKNIAGTEERVSASSKFWLCSADCLCTTINSLLTGGGMTYFFTKFLGLSEGRASTVWMIFAIWNALNDPLFGYISDHTKSKLGRRIPYIRYGAFFYSLIFVLTWIRWPLGTSQTALFIQMLSTLFLFDTLYTAIATSLYVMPYTMAVSNKARSGIFLWKIFFTLIAMAVPLVVFPLIKPEVGSDPTKFQLIMTGIGVLAFVIIFASTFFYKEKVTTESDRNENIFKAVIDCFRNRSFVVFEVLSFTVVFIQTILMQGVIYYFDEFDLPMPIAYGALGLGAVLGHCWPVWNGFRGGKGVAVAGAASILFSPPVGIASYLLGAAAVLAMGYLAVGSAVIAVSLPLLTALFGLGREAAAAAGVIGGVMLVRHSGNFARMRAGTEGRASVASRLKAYLKRKSFH